MQRVKMTDVLASGQVPRNEHYNDVVALCLDTALRSRNAVTIDRIHIPLRLRRFRYDNIPSVLQEASSFLYECRYCSGTAMREARRTLGGPTYDAGGQPSAYAGSFSSVAGHRLQRTASHQVYMYTMILFVPDSSSTL